MAFWSFQSLYHEVNFSLLQDVETAEKNVLPTADDVKAEKTHQVLNDVPNFVPFMFFVLSLNLFVIPCYFHVIPPC